jgi:hypothetical protein
VRPSKCLSLNPPTSHTEQAQITMGAFSGTLSATLSLPFVFMDMNARVGIGNTVKQMFKDEVPGSETEENLRPRTSRTSRLSTGGTDPAGKLNDPSFVTNSNRASHKVPTTFGTTATGRLQSDVTTDRGLETTKSGQDIAGLGTDPAAAHGGSLAGTEPFKPLQTSQTTAKPSNSSAENTASYSPNQSSLFPLTARARGSSVGGTASWLELSFPNPRTVLIGKSTNSC